MKQNSNPYSDVQQNVMELDRTLRQNIDPLLQGQVRVLKLRDGRAGLRHSGLDFVQVGFDGLYIESGMLAHFLNCRV